MLRLIGKSDAQVIALIHNDFDSAQERLLLQARKVLETLPNVEIKNEHLADRLSKYGFVNAAQVNEVKNLKEQKAAIEKTRGLKEGEAELVLHYKKSYPFLKFLTVKELDRLCEKWNLIHAGVENYKEAIPVKNLEDIEKAQKLLDVDILNTTYKLPRYKSGSKLQKLLNDLGLTTTITQKEATEICRKYHGYVPDGWDNVLKSNMWLFMAMNALIERRAGVPTTTNADELDKELARIRALKRSLRRLYSYHYDAVQIGESSDQLFIAAPKSHFNLDGLEKVGKYGFRKIFKMPEPKDPIVFRYVRGGIQVLTKWGLEASDPMLINDVDN